MSPAVERIMRNEGFQARCQRYAHGNGSSEAIAAAALRAVDTALVDCPPETIAAAAALVEVAERGLVALEQELECLLDSVCLLGSDLKPRRETIDPKFEDEAAELEETILTARTVLMRARGAA